MSGTRTESLAEVGYEARPTFLLFGTEEGAKPWLETGRLAGFRLVDRTPIAGGMERLDKQACVDVVVLATDVEADDDLDALREQIEAGAEEGRFGAIAAGPIGMADRLAAGLHPRVQHLIDADPCERLTALVLAAQRPPLRLHDVNKAQATLRLQQLSEEVGRIASLLSALSEDEAAAAAMAGLESHDGDPQRLEAGQIRAMIRARRMRDHFFKRDLFADPAWDMLLDLMAARLEKQQVAVSSLCIAAAVPPTTALRWIKALCDQGLFVRVADPEDGRRVFIELSEQAAAALESYLKAVQRITPFVL
jgi:DNA-binding MarR family transcriptional regulator